MRDDFTKIYAVTDEKYKKEDFDKNVKKENQMTTKGIEVGHIFYFSDKYSKPMNCLIDDQNGKKILLKWVLMVLVFQDWLEPLLKQIIITM